MIKLYLGNMIHDLRTSGEKKFCLTIKFNFVSSKDNNEKQLTHSKSDNMTTWKLWFVVLQMKLLMNFLVIHFFVGTRYV